MSTSRLLITENIWKCKVEKYSSEKFKFLQTFYIEQISTDGPKRVQVEIILDKNGKLIDDFWCHLTLLTHPLHTLDFHLTAWPACLSHFISMLSCRHKKFFSSEESTWPRKKKRENRVVIGVHWTVDKFFICYSNFPFPVVW